MKYKKFGNTDESLSAISLGSWGIGGVGWGDTDEKQSEAAVFKMLEYGVNVIDTAPVYGFVNPGKTRFWFWICRVLSGKNP